MYGCGADVRLCHLSQRLSYKWWSRTIALPLATGPFTIVHSSKAADCSSLVSVVSVGRRAYAMPRQARSMWFTFLHLPHRLPYAGHWLLRTLHGGFLPWPLSAQNRHSAVGSNVCPGFGSGLGLVVAAPLVRTSCCLLRRYVLLAAFTLGVSSRRDADRLPHSRVSTNLIISSIFIFWFWSLIKSN